MKIPLFVKEGDVFGMGPSSLAKGLMKIPSLVEEGDPLGMVRSSLYSLKDNDGGEEESSKNIDVSLIHIRKKYDQNIGIK